MDHYLDDAAQRLDPWVSPVLEPDLAGLPPAYVVTAEYDALRDEGEQYAARLSEAGVPVTVRRYEGMIHEFCAIPSMTQRRRSRTCPQLSLRPSTRPRPSDPCIHGPAAWPDGGRRLRTVEDH